MMPKRFTQYLVKEGTFEKEPLVVVDCGCAGGFSPLWDIYGEHVELYGFDPNELTRYVGNRHVYRATLSDRVGTRAFYQMAHANSSSFYRPDPRRTEVFPWESSMHVLEETELETTTLDVFAKACGLCGSWPDFIKMDVEGAELDILRGTRQVLNNVLGLSVEVLFRPVRIGQPSWRTVDAYLSASSFDIFHVKSYRHFRRTLSLCPFPENRGQAVWADVLYFRDLADVSQSPERWSPTRIAKFTSLLDLFGFPDCAIEVVERAYRADIVEESTMNHWRDLLTPLVDGQTVSYAEYWELLHERVDTMGLSAREIAYTYKRHWGRRI